MLSVRTARVLIAAYAALVLAAAAFVFSAEIVRDDGDGLSAVFLLVLSFPLGVLPLFTQVEGGAALVALTVAGLLQAVGMWLLTSRAVARRREPPRADVVPNSSG